jgi:dipeptide/tripeptide permease
MNLVLLTFYMISTIGMPPMQATLYFQMFMLVSILFTFVGALLADGFVGKFA